jgi:voltage-gated potassium channel
MFSRRIISEVQNNGLYRFIGFIFLVSFFLILVVTFYCQYEGWTVLDSLFFVVQTVSTVGYGFPAPTTDKSRLFTIFFILIGIFVIFAGINDFIYNNLSLLRNYLCKSTSLQVSEDLAIGDLYFYRKQLIRYITLLCFLLIFAAIVLKYNEQWTWITAFYFVVETSSV